MQMLEFLELVGAITALNGIAGIIVSKMAKLKKEKFFFSLMFFLFSGLGVVINGILIMFELKYKDWEAFRDPSVLLTFHFVLFVVAFVLNCISAFIHCFRLIKIF